MSRKSSYFNKVNNYTRLEEDHQHIHDDDIPKCSKNVFSFSDDKGVVIVRRNTNTLQFNLFNENKQLVEDITYLISNVVSHSIRRLEYEEEKVDKKGNKTITFYSDDLYEVVVTTYNGLYTVGDLPYDTATQLYRFVSNHVQLGVESKNVEKVPKKTKPKKDKTKKKVEEKKPSMYPALERLQNPPPFNPEAVVRAHSPKIQNYKPQLIEQPKPNHHHVHHSQHNLQNHHHHVQHVNQSQTEQKLIDLSNLPAPPNNIPLPPPYVPRQENNYQQRQALLV